MTTSPNTTPEGKDLIEGEEIETSDIAEMIVTGEGLN